MTQKDGSSPLGHTAPRRFTGGSASLSSENTYHQQSNRRILAPWSHGHQHLLPTEFTEPSPFSPQTSRGLLVYIAVSAEVEQLNQRNTRPPKPRNFVLYPVELPVQRLETVGACDWEWIESTR
jgi:hypothetical protein